RPHGKVAQRQGGRGSKETAGEAERLGRRRVEGPALPGPSARRLNRADGPAFIYSRMLTGPLLFPELADENGLVAVGGDLRPERLLEAYRRGVFPWYDESVPILWWSPDPRAIFEMDGLHVSRRLRRTIHSKRFDTTVNRDFRGVLDGCADRPGEGNWITPDMREAYERLHQLG